jgi:2-keto-4-pentenoate hydratase/2-oxohepta-3-ene-1,7-dioic acid hydratase in catechol pathway
VKLCRFCLPDDPRPRTGIFHDGKIYETDGENALGVHAPDAVSLLTPIGHASSLRLFSPDGSFVFGNSGAIFPPESTVLFSSDEGAGCSVMVAAVIGGLDRECSVEEATALIQGYSVLVGFQGPTGFYGPGFVLGPFVVTPDEVSATTSLSCRLLLEDEVVSEGTASLSPFPVWIASASVGGDLREGDVIASPPLPLSLPRALRDGDSVIGVVEKLGALGARVEA